MTTRFEYRHQYDDATDAIARHATDIFCEEESLTIQDAPDADINKLLARFGVKDSSVLPGQTLGIVDPAYYGDFSDRQPLRETLDTIRDAENKFMDLPATVRTRFNNDPWSLHEFITDPNNIEEAITLGLLHRKALERKTEQTPGDAIPPVTPT